jgi:hypothetical protein
MENESVNEMEKERMSENECMSAADDREQTKVRWIPGKGYR